MIIVFYFLSVVNILSFLLFAMIVPAAYLRRWPSVLQYRRMRHLAVAIVALITGVIGASVGQAAPVCSTITPAPAYSSINIRSAPAMGDNITGQLKRGQSAAVVRLTDSGWYELASTGSATGGGGYVASSVAVCVTDPTPTRLPSLTPMNAPITATPSFTRFWFDVDGSGDYETVIDCRQPCRAKMEQAP